MAHSKAVGVHGGEDLTALTGQGVDREVEGRHARDVNAFFQGGKREAPLVVRVHRAAGALGAVECYWPPFHVFRWPGFLNVPLSVMGLYLHHRLGLLADVLQIVVEPSVEFHRPVHAAHVGIGFCTVTASHFAVSIGLIGIIVGPLPGDGSSIDAGVPHELVGRESMVGVDVPVLHAPNEVNAALVIGKHIGQVTTLVPVIVPFCASNFGTGPSGERVERTDDIVGAHPHIVGGGVGGCAFVKGVVEHGSALRRAVSIEHFLDTNRARDGNDGLEVRRGLLSGFPVGRAGVGFAHQTHVSVGPLLLPQPVNHALDAGLFSESLDVLTVGRLAGAEG